MVSRYRVLVLLFVVVLLAIAAAVPASAQVDQFLGEIRYVGFNFAPVGWALCNGQVMSIAQNTALFSLLGTTYGGDGKTTFALPDMRGRVPVAMGQGVGLSNRNLGEQGGVETVTLTIPQLPVHRHGLETSSTTANTSSPNGTVLATSAAGAIYTNQLPNGKLHAKTVSTTGQGQPHENMQPFLGMTCIIALEGIYPSRN